ncbi:MAG: MoxR family ATPase [Fibrobacter sp.]|nr:MoxR family ATPase [Fibrobacter sp.]
MNIKTFKAIVKLLPDTQAVLVKGYHGIGKSQVIRQIAEDLGMECVTFMCSQVADVGDVIGLPSIVEGKTVFNPPFWYNPQKPVVLFFDEINRARPEISNALMQITLEQKILDLTLPKGTRIFAAINPSEDGKYDVEDMDPAKYDRFAVYELEPSVQEWLEYAESIHVHSSILEYIAKNNSDLDPYSNSDLVKVASRGSNNVLPSRRSWVKLSDVIYEGERRNLWDCSDGRKLMMVIASGFVGYATAINFAQSFKSRTLDPREVLFHFKSAHESSLSAMSSPEAIKFMNSIKNLVSADLNLVTKTVQENFLKILNCFSKDLQVALVNNLILEGMKNNDPWVQKLKCKKLEQFYMDVLSLNL